MPKHVIYSNMGSVPSGFYTCYIAVILDNNTIIIRYGSPTALHTSITFKVKEIEDIKVEEL